MSYKISNIVHILQISCFLSGYIPVLGVWATQSEELVLLFHTHTSFLPSNALPRLYALQPFLKSLLRKQKINYLWRYLLSVSVYIDWIVSSNLVRLKTCLKLTPQILCSLRLMTQLLRTLIDLNPSSFTSGSSQNVPGNLMSHSGFGIRKLLGNTGCTSSLLISTDLFDDVITEHLPRYYAVNILLVAAVSKWVLMYSKKPCERSVGNN